MAELSSYVGRDTNLSGFYNSILSGIQRQQEIAAKKQEAEDERARQIVKGIEGELSKVSSDGLRSADIGLFNKSYSKIKDSYYKMLTAGTNDERLQAAAEMRNEINATNDLVSRSKAIGRQDYDFGEDIRKNPGGYADDVRTKFNQRISTPLDKLSSELLNPQNFARRVDTSKVQGDIVKMAQDIAKASNNVTPSVGRMSLPSGGADVVEFVKEGSREAFIEGMVQQTAADPAYQAYIRENFPGLNSEEAINLIADQMQEAGQLTARSGRQVIRDRAPRSSESGSGGNSPSDYLVSGDNPISYGPDDQTRLTTAKDVRLTQRNKNIEGTIGIDMTTGNRVNVPAGSYNITGVYALPVLNRDIRYKDNPSAPTEIIQSGNFATGDFAKRRPQDVDYGDFILMNKEERDILGNTITKRYAVPRSNMPTELVQDKKIQAALQAYDSVPINQNNSVSSQQFRGVPEGGF